MAEARGKKRDESRDKGRREAASPEERAKEQAPQSPASSAAPPASEKAKPEAPTPLPSAAGPELKLRAAPEPRTPEVTAEQEKKAETEGEGAPFPIVGIGASAGGLEASQELLKALATNTGMAFIFVHHLAAEHESLLVEILARATTMPVAFATDGLRVEPNHVYVAPPGAFVALFHGTLNLMRPDEGRGPRTAIDYFLRSLSEDQRSLAIGVILSGTGADGAVGIRAIKAEDGLTYAQQPETAAYDSMPRSAIETGAVDFVLPAKEIADDLCRVSQHPFLRPTKELETQPTTEETERRELDRIFMMLRESAGVDFTYYKPTTVKRRIGRRMVVHKMERLGEYARYLKKHPEEINSLYQDLLINVTGFFREPESFDALKAEVFPALMRKRGVADPIRIWVPGCSTGEEPYSIAMALTEFLETQPVKPPIQVFATDISDTSIEKARQAVYPPNIEGEMTPERLSRFFTRTSAGFQLNKAIRDMCVFAKRDVTRDPPFSRLDVISCRNLLIYLGSVLQRRLIPVFHYALNADGFLFLGSSESVGDYTNLFTLVDPKYKIYSKIAVAARPPMEFGFRQYPLEPVPAPRQMPQPSVHASLNAQKEADRIALERYAPPGVLVNGEFDILQFRGDTTPYLRHAPGQASLNLVEMARQGLDAALKGAMQSVRDQKASVRVEGVQVRQNGDFRSVDLEIVPLPKQDDEQYYLVFFREPRVPGAAPAKGKARKVPREEVAVEQMRRDLEQTREQLRLTVEEKDASTEELRAANEEIQSSNEELQSINEELETAKEELQSTNEELTTLNEELQNRNFELQSTNDDLRNVLASVNVPIIILGKDLRIRRYTPTAERVLNLIPSDLGRPITDLKLKIDVPDLQKLVTKVLDDLASVERDVQDDHGCRYRLEVRPYRTAEDRIEGVVIALMDVTDAKRGKTPAPPA